MNEKAKAANGEQKPQDRVIASLRDAGRDYYETAQQRDELTREVATLKSEAAGYRVVIEAQTAQLANMESEVKTAYLVRDQAVADRAKYEALFVIQLAQMRAFAVPAAPLVRDRTDEPPEPPMP